ncbi:L-type lectin-domain containing protein [Micromonosporaceae bacterium Da 78-11]
MSSSRFFKTARGGLLAAFAVSIAAATAPTAAFATNADMPIDYSSFNGGYSTLERNGSADVLKLSTKQRVLRLTAGSFRQVGSAWATQKIDVTTSFESTFKAYLHHTAAGVPSADGFAFLVQNEGPRALGGWGGGLGYRGIERSVAVEFDTFRNSPDPSSNHVAVVLGGNPDIHGAVSEPAIPLYGKPFIARVTYDAPARSLKVYLKSLRAGSVEQLMLDQNVDLAAHVGASSAWVGFTAATGAGISKQDIYSWTVQTPDA